MDKLSFRVSTIILSLYKRCILTSIAVCVFFNAAALPLSAEETDVSPAAELPTPPNLVVLPFWGIDTAEFAVLVAEKVVMRRLEDTGFLIKELSGSKERQLDGETSPKTMSREELVELVSARGAEEEASYAAAGMLEKEGGLYHLSLLVVDVEHSEAVLSDRKTAVGMGDLDRIAKDYSERLVAAVFGSEKAEEMIAEREPEEAAGKDEQKSAEAEAQERGIEELERLAEEDPEEAISRLPENIQEEVKKRAKEEVKEEEIQKLYDEEKAQIQLEKRRNRQKYGMLASYGGRFTADIFSDLSVQARIRSLRAWGLYMNDYFEGDPYREYENFHDSARGLSFASYIFGTSAAGGLGYTYLGLPGDALYIRKGTRGLLTFSSLFYTAGKMVSLAGGSLGYISMDRYAAYLREGPDPEAVESAYDSYREIHTWYEWSRYAAYGLKFLGVAGTAVSYFWPGDRELLVPEEKYKRLLGIGNILSGAGAVTAQMSLNMLTRSVEGGITAQSPSGNPDADPSGTFRLYAWVLGGSSLALYTGSIVSSFIGLRGDGDEHNGEEGSRNGNGVADTGAAEKRSSYNLALLPGLEGFTMVFERRSF